MLINFSASEKVESLVADISADELKRLLANYITEPKEHFQAIEFGNFGTDKKIPNHIFFPAINTGLYNSYKETNYKIHHSRLAKHDTSNAFFVKKIAQDILKKFFKKTKISVIAKTTPFQHGTVYCDIFEISPVKLAHHLHSGYCTESARLYFVPTEIWDDFNKEKSNKWSSETINKLTSYPRVEFNLSGGKLFTAAETKATAEFKRVIHFDTAYGEIEDPRFFKVTDASGKSGLVLSRSLNPTNQNSAIKKLKLNFSKYYAERPPLKTIEEISKDQWLNIRKSSPFEIFLD